MKYDIVENAVFKLHSNSNSIQAVTKYSNCPVNNN